jgi:hypothetical protein
VFLVRVLKNPEVIPGQRAQSIAESAEPPVANTASPPPTELWAVAPTSAGAGRAKDKDDRTETSGMKKRAGPRGGLDQPKHVYDDPLGGIGLDRPAPKGGRASQVSEEEKPRTRKKTDNNPLEGEIRDDDAFRAADKKRFAEPPPAPAVAQPSEETAAPAKSASAPARALAPAATPLPRLHAIGNSPAAAKELSKADSADFNDESLVKEQAAEPSLDESVRKADRLFANQNWSAAAEAYRNLLRHYPGHKDAAKWRARIDQSLVAEREAVGNKAAKAKRATETLEGPKL